MAAEENRAILDRMYASWEEGDFSAGVEDFAPDADLVIDSKIPDAGVYSGLGGIRHYMTHFLSAWVKLTIVPDSFVEVRDDVALVEVTQRGVGQGSGVPAELHYFHLWRFRDGKVTHLESILDEADAREAAGLQPGSS